MLHDFKITWQYTVLEGIHGNVLHKLFAVPAKYALQ
jgi:hypothetical protein